MKTFLLACLFSLSSSLGLAAAVVDSPAPAFQVKDAAGKEQSLKDYSGQWLVLEWYNKDCPYVKKHYGSGNMQKLQKDYAAKGVKWLTVISSAPGKQGYLEAAQALENAKAGGATPTAILLDSSGAMGQAYGATTTPHMFVIDPQGKLVYAGAIDDNNSADPAVIATSQNYVRAALDSGLAGKAIATKSSPPYGCSVKY